MKGRVLREGAHRDLDLVLRGMARRNRALLNSIRQALAPPILPQPWYVSYVELSAGYGGTRGDDCGGARFLLRRPSVVFSVKDSMRGREREACLSPFFERMNSSNVQ